MYPLNQLKTLVSCGRDPARSLPFRRGFLLIPLISVCFALSPQTQAVVPAPDGGYFGANTAEGQNALNSLSTGTFNTAIGWFSVLVQTNAKFCTGVGAGTLLLNNANENTGVGAGTLLTNSTGVNNTGCGTFALFSNVGTGTVGTGSFNNAVGANSLLFNNDGDSNNALGESALFNNIHGAANTAIGDVALASNDSDGAGLGNSNTAVGAGALFANVDGDSNNAVGFSALGSNVGDNTGAGSFNNAIGFDAMGSNVSGAGNVAVGDSAGAGVEGSFNIYIGFAVSPGANENNTIRIGDTLDTGCFIGGIAGATVPGGLPVIVDASGHLGTVPADSPLSMSQMLKQRQIVQELKATTERQAAVIALQEGQIKTLTAGLRQQAEQIQKVSAQLEMVRPTPRVVENR
ncbi:MAG TPA: hypothetical protein VGY75_00925 [Candidatus Udaeobacter sp.]|jgi:hypothetical protein|nr:hypothetical protein [Candidatus Udaeobacter sp.]